LANIFFSGVGQQWQSLFDWWYKCCNLSQCWRVFQLVGLDITGSLWSPWWPNWDAAKHPINFTICFNTSSATFLFHKTSIIWICSHYNAPGKPKLDKVWKPFYLLVYIIAL